MSENTGEQTIAVEVFGFRESSKACACQSTLNFVCFDVGVDI